MFDISDKRRLYWLIDNYLQRVIDERKFCDEFYNSYDLEIDQSDLTELEYIMFSKLSDIVGRYSEFAEDHELDSNAFASKDELYQQIKITKDKLC